MALQKNWQIAQKAPPVFLEQFPEMPPVVLQCLWNRNKKTQEDIDLFFTPDWSRDVPDPFLFQQMSQVVERIFVALQTGEVITIHGDYDADGICGTALIYSALQDICRLAQKQGKEMFSVQKLETYIPHREEGYGFSVKTAEYLCKERNTSLIITVDCGISNQEAVAKAKAYGADTIICDHHALPEVLPQQALIIHPSRKGETYPQKDLCGCAVAFKLVSALFIYSRRQGLFFPEGYEKWFLDLVAIATVTDMVPLQGENRLLEKYGLLVLNKTRRLGLQELIKTLGTKKTLDTIAIGFYLGPRINAPGRLEHAQLALDLFLEEDAVRAKEKAQKLALINKQRQQKSEELYKRAKEKLQDIGEKKLLVIVEEDGIVGLVGLSAGKLCLEYGLPVFVVSKKGDLYAGSGRSIKEFHITQALYQAQEYLDHFGGHPQACGFSTTGEERFLKAMEIMEHYAYELLKDKDTTPVLEVESELSLKEISWEFWDWLEKMQPYGQGNPEPLFLSPSVKVVSACSIGTQGKHLRLSVLQEQGTVHHFIGFGLGNRLAEIVLGDSIDVVYHIGVNEWNGNRELQLFLKDFHS